MIKILKFIGLVIYEAAVFALVIWLAWYTGLGGNW